MTTNSVVIVERVKNEKSVGEWFMVFRAKSGNDKSVIDAYLSPLGTNEYNSLPGCTSVVGSEVCNGHYRHSVLDRWRILGIKRVSKNISMYFKYCF